MILTTHYIEEAEEMADRVGIIRKGEIILVEEKASLMEKLGKRQLILQLQQALPQLPSELQNFPLELAADCQSLVYTFDAKSQETGIADLIRKINNLGIDFKDLQTTQSSLEDIFVSLVGAKS